MRIAVLDDYQDKALELADWAALGAEVTVFNDTITDHAALVERLRPFDVICPMRERTPFPAHLIEALPSLRLLATTGHRNAAIDMAACKARGIAVCGTDSRLPPTGQLAMLMILAINRKLLPQALSMRDGGWQTPLGRDLDGLTLGLIGLGRLGGAVCKLGQAFGMKAIAWSSNLTDERCAEVGASRAASLEALLEEADAASVHMVLGPRSRGLIGAEQLARMKPDACIVNTSRGPIIDSQALLSALEAGRPGAAGLDVFDEEPLPADHALRSRRLIDEGRLLLTPHLGYATQGTMKVFYTQTVENIAAWKAGTPIRVIEG